MYKDLDTNKNYETFEDVIDYIQEDIDEDLLIEAFEDDLDELYGEINIAGWTCMASECLKRLSPMTYDCRFDDFIYNFFQDLKNDEADNINNVFKTLEDLGYKILKMEA